MSAKGQTEQQTEQFDDTSLCCELHSEETADNAAAIFSYARRPNVTSFPLPAQVCNSPLLNRRDSFKSRCRRRAARDRHQSPMSFKSFPMHELGNTIQRCHVTGNQPSRGGKQRLTVQSTRTRIKDNAGSQIRT